MLDSLNASAYVEQMLIDAKRKDGNKTSQNKWV